MTKLETLEEDDTLFKLQRYHLFTRIRDRTGLPSRAMVGQIQKSHQYQIKSIFGGIEDAFGPFRPDEGLPAYGSDSKRAESEASMIPRRNDIIEYLNRCEGVH